MGLSKPNYTQVPNEIFDLMPQMSNAEFRVVMVLVRRILGFHKPKDVPEPISLAQLTKATGLTKQSVLNGIEAAVERDIVEVVHNAGKRGMTGYCLVFEDAADSPDLSNEETDSNTDLSNKETGHYVNLSNKETSTGLEIRQPGARPKERSLNKTTPPANDESKTQKVVVGLSEVVKDYQHEIGIITPTISESLISSVEDYGPVAVQAAIKTAAHNNRRTMAYIQGVLKRTWAQGNVIPLRQNDLGPAPLNYDPDCGCDHGEVLINNSAGDLVSSRCPTCAAKFDQKAAS